jgi:hypothetical protein
VHEDIYAATLAARILRALIAISAYFGPEMEQLDAVNAFYNAKMNERLFIANLGVADTKLLNGWCLLVNMALYGMPRSLLL